MTVTSAQRIILLSAVTVGGIEVLKMAQTNEGFQPRVFIGGGIAYTMMSGVSEFAPGPAAAFATVFMITVFLKDGGTVLAKILNTGAAKPATTTKGKKLVKK